MVSISNNPFANPEIAKRYDVGRPYFHPSVISVIKQKLNVFENLPLALDVGCGTGQSSKALLAISGKVEAIDSSAAMLGHAYQNHRINYRQCRAEDLDFPKSTFDLITMSQIIHWTDHAPFFRNAFKTLKPRAHLVIYDNFFLWDTDLQSPVYHWFRNSYVSRFPPPKNQRPRLSADGEFKPKGFAFFGYETYEVPRRMSRAELVDHLLTQSNVATAVDQGAWTLEAIKQWLTDELQTFFADNITHEFKFGGPIYFLHRMDTI